MKNYYSIPPGEFFVADRIRKNLKKAEIYFPIKDVGTDLLVVLPRRRKPIRIQVKESRAYAHRDHSWHQVRAKKIRDADIFVFVHYVPVPDKRKINFEQRYLVIPRKDLHKECKRHKKASRGVYHFYFSFGQKEVFDYREDKKHGHDFSRYRDAWHLIKKSG